MMFQVSRQRVNCGPEQRITVATMAEARRAYDIAVSDGDQFAEIFDLEKDCQVLWHLAPMQHTSY